MADNDIIDFYKKADTNPAPEEPLKEQIETPEPVVSEAVVIPVPESNDPFDKFLFNLAEKLKTEKKITEQQQQQFNERVVQPTTDPTDPFAKFLESFAGLVKEDENINKEENIKEATIDFINKLKNDDFFDREESKEETKVETKLKKKSKKYLPPKFAKKLEQAQQDQPVIEQSTEPESKVKEQEPPNPYVKQLETTDKKKNKIEDKISNLSDIKKIISQQVQEQLSKYPNLGFTGGGGGTNAVQYAQGGVMDGNLTVNGTVNASTYLSGGTNLLNILSSSGGGGGAADRLVSGSESLILYPNGTLDFPNDTIRPPDETILTLESENPALSSYTRVALSPYAFFAYDNEGNSITFDEVDNAIVLTSQDEHEWVFNKQGILVGPHGALTVNSLSSLGQILSAGVPLHDIFLTAETDSQTLAYNDISEVLSISNGNSVSLSSLNDKGYIHTNFLPLSGGTVYGKLEVENLVVTSGLSSVSAVNLTITDPLIYIADGNNTNLYDIGLVGAFNDGTYQHTGLVRFTTPYNHWALFDGLTAEPLSAHIPREDPSFRLADLHLGGVYGTKILSGGVDLKDIFLTSETDSQTLSYNESSAELSISNGNIVSLSALSGQKFNQSLNTTDNVEFNQVNANVYLSGGVNLYNLLSSSGGGGGGGDPAVNTVVYTNSATWIDTSTAVQSNSASWFEPVRRFDYTTVAGIDYSYSGTAPYGTLEDNPIWKLIRLTYSNNGTISNQASAIDSWTGRLTATYV